MSAIPVLGTSLRVMAWYLAHPSLYAEALRKARSRIASRPADPAGRRRAESWCAERALSTEEAVVRITGRPALRPVRAEFRTVFAHADRAAGQCPIAMGGAANLDLLYWIAEHRRACEVVETGVAYGWSSLALLLSVARRDGRLISTDMPYPARGTEPFVGCVVPEEFRSHWTIVRRADREGLPIALRDMPAIDLAHYDSDKSYEGRRWAYRLLWRALRPGGVLVSDDVGDDMGFHDFCREVGVDPVIVGQAGAAAIKYAGVAWS